MAVWGEIQQKGEITDIKQVMNYVYQLEEQIRYALSHLGDENITPGSIGVEQLTPGVKQNITNIEINVEAAQNRIRETGNVLNNRITNEIGDFSVLSQTATSITQAVSDKLGNYSTTRQTEELISTYVGNALGAYSNTTQTADMIANYVTNALGSYSTSLQTADMIANYVANNAYGQVSGITITSPGIEITGSQYVKIGTSGKLIVRSGNFTVDENNNVTIGGFTIANGYIGSINDGVYMRKYVNSLTPAAIFVADNLGYVKFRSDGSGETIVYGDLKTNKLWLRDPNTSTYVDVTAKILALP